VLATKPKVLAIGETHAQKGQPAVPSSTKRFTASLLPEFKGRAADLVLELWVADGACGEQEKRVAKQQKEVTKRQAASNQNEFVALRRRAGELGLRTHVLRPSCEQYRKVVAAGKDGVLVMLTMITQLTVKKTKALLTQQGQAKAPPMIVAYGGAMHNDLVPAPSRNDWSFGPELNAATGGKYVELDLIVPEFIGDSDTWKSLPWYAQYDRNAHPDKTTLFNPHPGSYVLIFPRTATPRERSD